MQSKAYSIGHLDNNQSTAQTHLNMNVFKVFSNNLHPAEFLYLHNAK